MDGLLNQLNNFGLKADPKTRDDFIISGIIEASTLPKSFYIPDPFPVKCQWSRPSCTAQAYSHHKERQEQVALSARFCMALEKQLEANQYEGANLVSPFTVGANRGICSEAISPEPNQMMSWTDYINVKAIPGQAMADAGTHRSQQPARVNRTVEDIKQSIFKTKNSVVIAIDWYREFNRPDNGILPATFNQYVTGHAIDVIGWDDDTQLLKFKNSFGNSWGDGHGYGYIPYSIFQRICVGAYTSVDLPSELPVDTMYGQKRNFLAEQKTAFNPWLINKIKRLPTNREIKALVYGFWDFDAVYKGRVGDKWLYNVKQ